MLTLSSNKNPTNMDNQFVSTNIYTVHHLQLKHMEADYAEKICLQMWLSHLETLSQITEVSMYISGLHYL